MLVRLPADQVVAKEEHGSARTLTCVDVTSEVAVAAADKVCCAGSLGVV